MRKNGRSAEQFEATRAGVRLNATSQLTFHCTLRSLLNTLYLIHYSDERSTHLCMRISSRHEVKFDRTRLRERIYNTTDHDVPFASALFEARLSEVYIAEKCQQKR